VSIEIAESQAGADYSVGVNYNIANAAPMEEPHGSRRTFLPQRLWIKSDGYTIRRFAIIGLNVKKDGSLGAQRIEVDYWGSGNAPEWVRPALDDHLARHSLEAIITRVLADHDHADGAGMRWHPTGEPTEQALKVAARIAKEVLDGA